MDRSPRWSGAGAHDVGKEAEGGVCSAWRRQGFEGLTAVCNCLLGGRRKKQNQILLRHAWGQNKRQ